MIRLSGMPAQASIKLSPVSELTVILSAFATDGIRKEVIATKHIAKNRVMVSPFTMNLCASPQ